MNDAAPTFSDRFLVPGRYRPRYHVTKRVFDLAVTVGALIVLWPLLLLIAIFVKLDSPGPVLFRQQRVGARMRNQGRQTFWEVHLFSVYKFRSMVANADESIHREHIRAFVEGSLQQSESGNRYFKLTNDPRITTMGRLLRRMSLDELPQLFNVLRGEMSLVGPRPVPEYEVAEYREAWQYDRLATLPGITGLWQVSGRSQVSFEEMVLLDVEYIRRQSFLLDAWIILQTVPAVLSGTGAE